MMGIGHKMCKNFHRCLTANKFNLDVDPVAVVCQAKEIVRRTEVLYDQIK